MAHSRINRPGGIAPPPRASQTPTPETKSKREPPRDPLPPVRADKEPPKTQPGAPRELAGPLRESLASVRAQIEAGISSGKIPAQGSPRLALEQRAAALAQHLRSNDVPKAAQDVAELARLLQTTNLASPATWRAVGVLRTALMTELERQVGDRFHHHGGILERHRVPEEVLELEEYSQEGLARLSPELALSPRQEAAVLAVKKMCLDLEEIRAAGEAVSPDAAFLLGLQQNLLRAAWERQDPIAWPPGAKTTTIAYPRWEQNRNMLRAALANPTKLPPNVLEGLGWSTSVVIRASQATNIEQPVIPDAPAAPQAPAKTHASTPTLPTRPPTPGLRIPTAPTVPLPKLPAPAAPRAPRQDAVQRPPPKLVMPPGLLELHLALTTLFDEAPHDLGTKLGDVLSDYRQSVGSVSRLLPPLPFSYETPIAMSFEVAPDHRITLPAGTRISQSQDGYRAVAPGAFVETPHSTVVASQAELTLGEHLDRLRVATLVVSSPDSLVLLTGANVTDDREAGRVFIRANALRIDGNRDDVQLDNASIFYDATGNLGVQAGYFAYAGSGATGGIRDFSLTQHIEATRSTMALSGRDVSLTSLAGGLQADSLTVDLTQSDANDTAHMRARGLRVGNHMTEGFADELDLTAVRQQNGSLAVAFAVVDAHVGWQGSQLETTGRTLATIEYGPDGLPDTATFHSSRALFQDDRSAVTGSQTDLRLRFDGQGNLAAGSLTGEELVYSNEQYALRGTGSTLDFDLDPTGQFRRIHARSGDFDYHRTDGIQQDVHVENGSLLLTYGEGGSIESAAGSGDLVTFTDARTRLVADGGSAELLYENNVPVGFAAEAERFAATTGMGSPNESTISAVDASLRASFDAQGAPREIVAAGGDVAWQGAFGSITTRGQSHARVLMDGEKLVRVDLGGEHAVWNDGRGRSLVALAHEAHAKFDDAGGLKKLTAKVGMAQYTLPDGRILQVTDGEAELHYTAGVLERVTSATGKLRFVNPSGPDLQADAVALNVSFFKNGGIKEAHAAAGSVVVGNLELEELTARATLNEAGEILSGEATTLAIEGSIAGYELQGERVHVGVERDGKDLVADGHADAVAIHEGLPERLQATGLDIRLRLREDGSVASANVASDYVGYGRQVRVSDLIAHVAFNADGSVHSGGLQAGELAYETPEGLVAATGLAARYADRRLAAEASTLSWTGRDGKTFTGTGVGLTLTTHENGAIEAATVRVGEGRIGWNEHSAYAVGVDGAVAQDESGAPQRVDLAMSSLDYAGSIGELYIKNGTVQFLRDPQTHSATATVTAQQFTFDGELGTLSGSGGIVLNARLDEHGVTRHVDVTAGRFLHSRDGEVLKVENGRVAFDFDAQGKLVRAALAAGTGNYRGEFGNLEVTGLELVYGDNGRRDLRATVQFLHLSNVSTGSGTLQLDLHGAKLTARADGDSFSNLNFDTERIRLHTKLQSGKTFSAEMRDLSLAVRTHKDGSRSLDFGSGQSAFQFGDTSLDVEQIQSLHLETDALGALRAFDLLMPGETLVNHLDEQYGNIVMGITNLSATGERTTTTSLTELGRAIGSGAVSLTGVLGAQPTKKAPSTESYRLQIAFDLLEATNLPKGVLDGLAKPSEPGEYFKLRIRDGEIAVDEGELHLSIGAASVMHEVLGAPGEASNPATDIYLRQLDVTLTRSDSGSPRALNFTLGGIAGQIGHTRLRATGPQGNPLEGAVEFSADGTRITKASLFIPDRGEVLIVDETQGTEILLRDKQWFAVEQDAEGNVNLQAHGLKGHYLSKFTNIYAHGGNANISVSNEGEIRINHLDGKYTLQSMDDKGTIRSELHIDIREINDMLLELTGIQENPTAVSVHLIPTSDGSSFTARITGTLGNIPFEATFDKLGEVKSITDMRLNRIYAYLGDPSGKGYVKVSAYGGLVSVEGKEIEGTITYQPFDLARAHQAFAQIMSRDTIGKGEIKADADGVIRWAPLTDGLRLEVVAMLPEERGQPFGAPTPANAEDRRQMQGDTHVPGGFGFSMGAGATTEDEVTYIADLFFYALGASYMKAHFTKGSLRVLGVPLGNTLTLPMSVAAGINLVRAAAHEQLFTTRQGRDVYGSDVTELAAGVIANVLAKQPDNSKFKELGSPGAAFLRLARRLHWDNIDLAMSLDALYEVDMELKHQGVSVRAMFTADF